MGCGYAIPESFHQVRGPAAASCGPFSFFQPPRSHLMPNDPLRDASRHNAEEASDYASRQEAHTMQRGRDREGQAARPPRAAVTRLFVLDTTVLMHDPPSLFSYEEHDVFLPMVTLEELDDNKKGMSEVARNARQASRFLDEIVSQEGGDLEKGYSLRGKSGGEAAGNLFLQTHAVNVEIPESVASQKADNVILGVAMHLQQKYPKRDVVLVSKDINMRIKAHAIGLPAEHYFNAHGPDDTD